MAVLELELAAEVLGELDKMQIVGSDSPEYRFNRPGQGLRICISKMFLCDAACPGIILGELLG